METERPDQEAIDAFVNIAGVSEAVAVQKLQKHGGDLNSAMDAYFDELNGNNVPIVNNTSAPQQDRMQIDDMVHTGPRPPEFFLLSATGVLDHFFSTNNLRSMFHRPMFFPSREIDEINFHRSIFDRIPSNLGQEPFVSHPREAREIPIEVKNSNESPSNHRLAPTIVDVTGTEHDQGPEIRGTVTMNDDDYVSGNDLPSRSTQSDYASDTDIPAQSAQSDYLDHNIEEKMFLAVLEASRRDTEEKHSVKSFETGMNLGDPGAISVVIHKENENPPYAVSSEPGVCHSTANEELPNCSTVQGSQPSLECGSSFILKDAEECPLVRQKPKRLSSSFMVPPKKSVDCAPLNFSSSMDQDQNSIYPSVALQSQSTYQPDEELDRQHATRETSLPQEPLRDENNVVNILVRMPDGCCLSSRFLKTDRLKVVFNFIQTCGGVEPENYKLARSYPRRTFSVVDGSLRLQDIGLTRKQEALYMEPV